MRKQNKGSLWLVFFIGLLAGGVGGALVGGVVALATVRGFKPPILAALIPSLTPTVTLSPTPIPTVTPTWTVTPSRTVTPSPTATPSATPSATPTASPTFTPLPTASATATATFTPVPTLMDVIEQVEPSVVRIAASSNEIDEPQPVGSGVALLEPGVIVTNYHVVENAQRIRVLTGDEQLIDATLVGGDFFTDIAVLRVDQPLALKPLTLSTDKELRIGQSVFAIGSALGDFRNSVTSGIVSGLNRSVLVSDLGFAYERLIQTDAAINRGNSGGPLLNRDGDVIGINTLVVRGALLDGDIEGLGFAIPAATVEQTARLLLDEGAVARPFLGVRHEMVTPTVARRYQINQTSGELVQYVEFGSPAAQAGIQMGDLLMSINGQEIDKDHPLINLLMQYSVNDTIEVRILRDEIEYFFFVTLTERQ
ncbi:MAG: trypsin-like peptidase domain-containing protein [Ardenticatenaceae bacterium]